MRGTSILAISLLFASVANAQTRERAGMALDRADADGDGVVTREEFMNARAEQFASRDRNRDGFIDKNDMAKRGARRTRASQAMNAIVDRFDSDNDGKVAKREFVDGGGQLFDRVDADQSGTLDKKEIEAAKASLQEVMGK
jgi:Ca2+-binding EF-hand superfamily protein